MEQTINSSFDSFFDNFFSKPEEDLISQNTRTDSVYQKGYWVMVCYC